MIKKRAIITTIASFLCFSTIVQTGFALWMFDVPQEESNQIHSANAVLETYAENGNLILNKQEGYNEFNLVLEQQDSKYAYSPTGVFFTPSINLVYKDYVIPSNCQAIINGKIAIENEALNNYIEYYNPLYKEEVNGVIFYTFINQSIFTVKPENVANYLGEGGTSVSFVLKPKFRYKKGMSPTTVSAYENMINQINNAYVTNGYLTSVKIYLSITLEEVK